MPKVIDFGVAKAIDQPLTERTLFTQFGMIIGTPEYMSPEQSQMGGLDIDTRSDIYSLGVLLYELLTGSTPLEKERLRAAAFTEVLRRIREEEPPRPSTRLGTTEETASIAAQRWTEPAKLARLVRGELDWIVMKALEKDRTRRYESAGGHGARHQAAPGWRPGGGGPAISPLSTAHVRPQAPDGAGDGERLVVTLLMLAAVVSTWQAVRRHTGRGPRPPSNLAMAQEGEESARQVRVGMGGDGGVLPRQDPLGSATGGQDGGLGRDVKLRDAIEHAEAIYRRHVLPISPRSRRASVMRSA